MKRWIGRVGSVLLFLLLTALIYRIAAYSLRPDDEGVRTRLEGFYGEEENSLDAVFVGSSAVYSFFSPLRLWKGTGITSYLYATPNQTVPMIRYILAECRKTQPDALYVIELRPMLASEEDKAAIRNDLRRLTDNMPYSINRSRLIGALAEPSERLSYELDLIKYHGNWKNWELSNVTFFWKKENIMKGWSFVSAYETIEKRDWKAVNARIPVSPENDKDLRELLFWCRENKVQALFVATPFALSRRQEKVYNSVGDIVSEYGYEFWNFCRRYDEIGLDFATDYYDFRHTNTLGAIKCTDYLGQELLKYCERNSIITGRANEKQKEQWEECWKQYQPMEEESVRVIRQKIQNGEVGQ